MAFAHSAPTVPDFAAQARAWALRVVMFEAQLCTRASPIASELEQLLNDGMVLLAQATGQDPIAVMRDVAIEIRAHIDTSAAITKAAAKEAP